jgi:sugar lactone lactonase YvrE
MSTVFDDTPCALGEGPLWHPERGQLFWFDILGCRLHTRAPGATRSWSFDGHVSAAGWVDRDSLLIAGETSLFLFHLETGASEAVAPLEPEMPDNRPNDGRADPHGGFWIGTMDKAEKRKSGSIYRYYRGEVRTLYPHIAIPNAISFAPDGRTAFYADTPDGKVWRQRLTEADGWPVGDPQIFLDLRADGLHPDGAVVDRDGVFWNAQWGAGRVAAYAPDGSFLHAVEFPAVNTTCPAFGAGDLYCTSARKGLSSETLADGQAHGATFVARDVARGQDEHRVIL